MEKLSLNKFKKHCAKIEHIKVTFGGANGVTQCATNSATTTWFFGTDVSVETDTGTDGGAAKTNSAEAVRTL